MSEADVGWLLRHRDGVQHGPFRLADLVEAAGKGNVAADTCVRHEVHTRGQWIVAARLQPIASAMSSGGSGTAAPSGGNVAANRPATPRPAPQQQAAPAPSQAQPGRSAQPPKQPTQPGNTSAAAVENEPKTAERSGSSPGSIFGASNDGQPSDAAATSPESSDSAAGVAITSRRHDDGFPVPKTFFSALQTLLTDFRFRRFTTPWIVKILWALALLAAILVLLSVTYHLLVQPSMSAPGPRTAEGEWEFTPLAGQSFFELPIFTLAIWLLAVMVAILCLRMTLELVVIFFRVSGSLAEMRKHLQSIVETADR